MSTICAISGLSNDENLKTFLIFSKTNSVWPGLWNFKMILFVSCIYFQTPTDLGWNPGCLWGHDWGLLLESANSVPVCQQIFRSFINEVSGSFAGQPGFHEDWPKRIDVQLVEGNRLVRFIRMFEVPGYGIKYQFYNKCHASLKHASYLIVTCQNLQFWQVCSFVGLSVCLSVC